ncbi:MAG: SHOCT domain-containing protein [Egibacteraceae bacterium]
MMGPGMMGGMWLGMLLWTLLGIALLVFVVLACVWLVRSLKGGAHDATHARPQRALDELERRYAQGEIDRDEFVQRREDLSKR